MVWLVIQPILLFLLLLTLLLIYTTYRVNHGKKQHLFSRGKIPTTMPDGPLKGSAFYTGPWRGKTFNAKDHSGINLVQWSSHVVEEFPFKTYVGKGLKDKALDVIKIDYDIPQNPFWLRIVLDEIAEIKPGEFLGKMHLRLPLGIAFSVVYFSLNYSHPERSGGI